MIEEMLNWDKKCRDSLDSLLDWLLVTPENQLAYEAIRIVDGLEAARKEFGIFMPKAFEVTIRESIELAT